MTTTQVTCAYCGEPGRTLCGKAECIAREDPSTRAGRRAFRKRTGREPSEPIPVREILKAALPKFTSLADIADYNRSAKVRLHFRNSAGHTGTYICRAGYALRPNQSRRFWPDHEKGETEESLGWPVPYWNAEDIVRVDILDLSAR